MNIQVQLNPVDFFKPSEKQKMVRIIATFQKWGVKLRFSTRELKSVLARVIGRLPTKSLKRDAVLATSAPASIFSS